MEITPWVIGPGLLLQRPSPFCWCAPPQLVQVAVVDFSGLSTSRPLHLIHQMPPRTGVQGLPASQFHMHPLLHCNGVGWSSGLARSAGVKLVVLVSTRARTLLALVDLPGDFHPAYCVGLPEAATVSLLLPCLLWGWPGVSVPALCSSRR